jgi:hypothetical protein
MEFGVIEKNSKALCCLCSETVVSRTFNVKRHFEKNHKNVCSMSNEEIREFITQKIKQYTKQTSSFVSSFRPRNNITAASFHLSCCIAQHGKPLSDGDFLKAAFLVMSDTLFEDFPNKQQIVNRIEEMPASRNTVKDRIIRMSEDVSEQMKADLDNAQMFSVCLDESTDVIFPISRFGENIAVYFKTSCC